MIIKFRKKSEQAVKLLSAQPSLLPGDNNENSTNWFYPH
jgi:hypothetical protein